MAASSPTIKGDKLICLGKTYLLHAQELGDAVPDRYIHEDHIRKTAFW